MPQVSNYWAYTLTEEKDQYILEDYKNKNKNSSLRNQKYKSQKKNLYF